MKLFDDSSRVNFCIAPRMLGMRETLCNFHDLGRRRRRTGVFAPPSRVTRQMKREEKEGGEEIKKNTQSAGIRAPH